MNRNPPKSGVDPAHAATVATEGGEVTDHNHQWLDRTDTAGAESPFDEVRTDHGEPPQVTDLDLPAIEPISMPVVAPPREKTPAEIETRGSGVLSNDPWVGTLVANRYRIESAIASGGMGRVYLATQLPLGRPVAVKMVRTEVSGSRQQFIRRFFLEASACAKLTHPNIITIHDYGETDGGDVFMAMEYLDGRSLDKEIKHTAPMPPERALHIGIQICRALREAHAKGIIHRDLKPQNVMLVASGDEQDFVKVLDFGLVKMLSAGEGSPDVELTRAGVLLGSPNYMSPEQILGGTLDARTDIYSFGVVLYKMLSGRNPYARDADVDVIYKHVYHPVPSIADAGVAALPIVEALVAKCLAKSQSDRFASCKELVIALKDARRVVLGGAPKKKKKKVVEDLDLDDGIPLAEAEEVVAPQAPPPIDLPEPQALSVEPSNAPSGSANPSVSPSGGAASRSGTIFRARASSIAPGSSIAQVFLRSKSGVPIGPMPLRQLEVLYYSKIVDDNTPVSNDGIRFAAVSLNGELVQRLAAIKQRILNGEDPWNRPRPSVAPPQGATPLKAMLECAVNEASGYLTFARAQGQVRLSYSSGRIVEVETDLPGLGLADVLILKGIFNRKDFDDRLPVPPARSGDLGDALIAAGLIPPHLFLERLIEWAKQVLSTVVMFEPGSAKFDELEVAVAQVPLGFERFAILTEIVRSGVTREHAEHSFGEKQSHVIVPSTPNGATIDDFRLAPKELRTLRAADGRQMVKDIIGAAPKEQRESVAKTLYFGLEVGLISWGEDQVLPKERSEAQRLQQVYLKLKEKNALEILNVSEASSDEEVRTRYTELAKTYHPDSARANAAPELVEALKQLFNLVQEAYQTAETEEKRTKYKQMRELGYEGQAVSEEEVVRRILEAEVLFKKAKTLIKMSKYDEAIASMKEAISRKPRDIELRVHLRYFEFLPNKADRVGEANRAIADITKLIRNEESEIAAAFLFLGRLHKIVGREDLAVKYFKKVLKFDPKNHEAESEIRLTNLREQKKRKSLISRLGGGSED